MVVISAVIRFSFALRRPTITSFPDEYAYSQLARGLAESGRPVIRGAGAHFPALLEPLLAAPFWLFGNPQLAFRLTQSEGCIAVSLAAVPAFLIARRLALGPNLALCSAAGALVAPGLLYATYSTADSVGYPLALGAVYAGIVSLDSPGRKAQLSFLTLACLASFARLQYLLLLPIRGRCGNGCGAGQRSRSPPFGRSDPRIRRAAGGRDPRDRRRPASRPLRRTAPSPRLPRLARSPAHSGCGAAVVLGGHRPRPRCDRGPCAGGALLCANRARVRGARGAPRHRACRRNGGGRRPELWQLHRALPDLLLPATCPGLLSLGACRRGKTNDHRSLGGACCPRGRRPASELRLGKRWADSPLLFAVSELDSLSGTGTTAIAAAGAGLLLSGAAVFALLRPRNGVGIAIAVFLGVSVVVSAGATSWDLRGSIDASRGSFSGPARWIDRSGAGDVTLMATPGSNPGDALEQLFWNLSVHRAVRQYGVPPLDSFDQPQVTATRGGSLYAAGGSSPAQYSSTSSAPGSLSTTPARR